MTGRPTFARVDLDALARNFRTLAGFVAGGRVAGEVVPGVIGVVKANAYGHGAVRVGLALEAAGASMLACADIAEGVTLREGGVTVPILIFGALSVGDVDGIFEHDLTPTVSTPSAAKTLEAAALRHQVRLSLPPQDRHRHEPARLPPRSARSDAAADRGQPGHWRSRASTRTSPPPTCPTIRCSASSGSASRRRGAPSPPSASGRASPTWPTARRCCATSGCGSTTCGPGCCSTGWCRHRWRRRWRSSR